MSNYDIVLANALVVTMDDDRRIIKNGAVAIKGNRIAGVGGADAFPASSADHYIDCDGKVIIPGLVDVHNQPSSVRAEDWAMGWRYGNG